MHRAAALEGQLVCLMVPLEACHLTLDPGQWSAADVASAVWDLVFAA